MVRDFDTKTPLWLDENNRGNAYLYLLAGSSLKTGAEVLQTSSACRFYDLVIIKLKNFTAVRSDLRFYSRVLENLNNEKRMECV